MIAQEITKFSLITKIKTMKLKKMVTERKEVEVEVNLPFFGKTAYEHFVIFADENESPFGFKVWKLDDNVVISTIVYFPEVQSFTECPEQEFWTAFAEGSKLLSKKEFMCRQAAKGLPAAEWDFSKEFHDTTPTPEEKLDHLRTTSMMDSV